MPPLCVQATLVSGTKVKVGSCSYGTYGNKSQQEGVLMRKQVCTDGASDESQTMSKISMLS